MRLLRPLPADRTLEQIQRHYLVEKALAESLKKANQAERKRIYATMYDELFRQVPDHPRLTRRADEELTRRANQDKLTLIRDFLTPACVFIEFAPGDCRFALEVTRFAKTVYAIDISDQRAAGQVSPRNFNLIVYDGYRLDNVQPGSADVVFSDQFIEHLHPEDTRLHFELVYQLLKPGGKYIFRTPQAFTGPYDVSMYFSDEPQGFHLKEWTYRELRPVLTEAKFSQILAVRQIRTKPWRLPYLFAEMSELLLTPLPRRYQRMLAHRFVPSISIVAVK